MKHKNITYLLAVCLSLLSIPASATTPDGSIVNAVQAALEAAAKSQILPMAITWLGALMAIQMVVTNLGVLKSGGDLETVFAKFLGSILWFTFCVYVMNNGAGFIDSIGTSIINEFMPSWLSPGYILAILTTVTGGLIAGIGFSGIMVLGSGNPMIALILTVIMFVIVGVGLYVSIKIFMLKLELGLILILAPLSFSFLGLNALKDQGIAPFKALISLVYRIILFGLVCTAFKEVGTVTTTALQGIDWKNPADWVGATKLLFSAMFAFPMLGYLVYKSDSIASSLAGGSTNMGPGDVASAAAAGAAAGAAVATGGAGAMGAATKIPESMASFMSKIGGGGGSVSNASSMGAGGFSSPAPMPSTPSASLSTGPGASDKSDFSSQASPQPDLASQNISPHKVAAMKAEETAIASGASPQAVKAASNAAYMNSLNGSGASANISGPASSSSPEKSPTQQGGNKKSLLEQLSNANHHISQEKAATHVSINTMNSD